MKFLLETDHYVDDYLLPSGATVGDGEGAVHDWRYSKDEPRIGKKAGELRPVSRSMTGLDEEGRKAIKLAFGVEKSDYDPTAAIPIQGTTKAPGLAQAKSPGFPKVGS